MKKYILSYLKYKSFMLEKCGKLGPLTPCTESYHMAEHRDTQQSSGPWPIHTTWTCCATCMKPLNNVECSCWPSLPLLVPLHLTQFPLSFIRLSQLYTPIQTFVGKWVQKDLAFLQPCDLEWRSRSLTQYQITESSCVSYHIISYLKEVHKICIFPIKNHLYHKLQ